MRQRDKAERAMAALRAGDASAAILAAREAAEADPAALSLWINLALACRLFVFRTC